MYVRSTKLEKTSLSFTNGLALNSSVALRLILIKLLSANGDGEIRTLDPLLARQVLSQLSYTPMDAGLSFRTSLPVFSFVYSRSGLGLSEPFPISLRLWMNFTCFSLLGVGLSGLEPPTSRLSGVRSNQLSYKPIGIRQPPAFPCRLQHSIIGRLGLNHRVRDGNGCVP